MKIQLIIEGTERSVVMVPENDGDKVVLAAVAGRQPDPREGNTTVLPDEAKVKIDWSEDRAPYKKPLKLSIILPSE